jgi:hypothetical protein
MIDSLRLLFRSETSHANIVHPSVVPKKVFGDNHAVRTRRDDILSIDMRSACVFSQQGNRKVILMSNPVTIECEKAALT